MTWFWVVLAFCVGATLLAAAWWHSGRAKPEVRLRHTQQMLGMEVDRHAQQESRESGPSL